MKTKKSIKDLNSTIPHTSLESFIVMPKNIPRILVIGETGTGKSSLCNKMAGVRYKKISKFNPTFKITTTTVEVDNKCNVEPIFKVQRGQDSVTQETSWAEVNYLGDDRKKLIIIDTPGLNDKNVDNGKKHRKDLQLKLEAMEQVDLILILLDKPSSRLTKSLKDMMYDIIGIFGGNENLYGHFAVGFSHCDESDNSWTQNLEINDVNWKTTFQETFFNRTDEKQNQTQISYFSSVQDEHGAEWSRYDDFEHFYQRCVESHENPLKSIDCQTMSKLSQAVEKIMV